MSNNNKLLALLILFLVAACSTTPEGRHQLSLVSQERATRDGARAFERIKNRHVLVNDVGQANYLKCVVKVLTSNDPQLDGKWEIAIIRNDQPNAFALPGKKIAVNSGMLRVTVNQDQLAAALAHEIAHIKAGHGEESTSQQVALEGLNLISKITDRGYSLATSNSISAIGGTIQLGLLYPMSKVQEEEADMIGLELMAKAGFDPNEALHFWQNMQIYGDLGSDGFFSTHPSHRERIEKIEKRIALRNWSEKDDGKERQPKCTTEL